MLNIVGTESRKKNRLVLHNIQSSQNNDFNVKIKLSHKFASIQNTISFLHKIEIETKQNESIHQTVLKSM